MGQVQALPESGIDKMGQWIQKQDWKQIYECSDAHKKAEVLHKMLIDALDTFLTIKNITFKSDDAQWVSKRT